MKKRSASTALAMMAALAAMGGMPLPKPKPPKVRKEKPAYSDEDLAEMDRLFQDRTSPGRKAYKKFLKELRMKYGQG